MPSFWLFAHKIGQQPFVNTGVGQRGRGTPRRTAPLDAQRKAAAARGPLLCRGKLEPVIKMQSRAWWGRGEQKLQEAR